MRISGRGWRGWLSAAIVVAVLVWVVYVGLGTLAGWFGLQGNPNHLNAITLGILVPLAFAAMALLLLNDR